jgi:hypothetical protein
MATEEAAATVGTRGYTSLLQKADVSLRNTGQRELGFLRSPSVAEAASCCDRRSRGRYSLRWNKHHSEHFSSQTTFGGGASFAGHLDFIICAIIAIAALNEISVRARS